MAYTSNDKIIEAVQKLQDNNMSIESIAGLIGIAVKTLKTWMTKGSHSENVKILFDAAENVGEVDYSEILLKLYVIGKENHRYKLTRDQMCLIFGVDVSEDISKKVKKLHETMFNNGYWFLEDKTDYLVASRAQFFKYVNKKFTDMLVTSVVEEKDIEEEKE